MAATLGGPHANPVWSTFIFVTCMLLFLFYLESMINPMDLLASKSFVSTEYLKRTVLVLPGNRSEFITHGELYTDHFDLKAPGSTLVSIEIPQTAEKTLGMHLIMDIDPESGLTCNCTSKVLPGQDLSRNICSCRRLNGGDKQEWFVDRLTLGWPCGVLAGWSDLTLACLDSELYRREDRHIKRRYARITMLRDPVLRYIKEWDEVTSHGQMPIYGIHCHPLDGTTCFNGNWTGVTLDSFLRCPGNPANNRLVRTFANISHVPCFLVKQALSRRDQYFKSGSTSISNISHFLLESAKENLNQMPFFGLVEYLPETDLLFEYTFGIKFLKTFSLNTKEPTIHLTAEQSEKINSLNQLDKELYAFAKKLFFERLANFSRLHSRNLQ